MENIVRNSAWLYDFNNRNNILDIPFYIEYANRQKGDILELGCGTGRVALVLAEHGYFVTGIDLSKQMLIIFRQKLKARPSLANNITLIHGDMSDFCLKCEFSLIIAPFHAFQQLTDDDAIDKALINIREHLKAKGLFIINVFSPHPIMDESWCYPETIKWQQVDEITGNYVVKKYGGDKIDTENQIIYFHYAFEITNTAGKTERIVDELSLKYYYKNQLKSRIENAGFKIVEYFTNYEKTEYDQSEIIFVCEKKLT